MVLPSRWSTIRPRPNRPPDPVKRVVECGVGDDVDMVIVDGNIVMRDGVISGVDFAQLRRDAQLAGELIWSTLPDWDPLERTHEDACPWSYPMAC